MSDLTDAIVILLNDRFAGKFLDDGPSGMQILNFRIGAPPQLEDEPAYANTIYVRFKDLGWKDTPRSNYHGIVEMFALNGGFKVYDSLEQIYQERLKRGKKLLGYTPKDGSS